MGVLYTLPFEGQNKVTSAYGSRMLNGKKEFHPGWDIVGLDSTDICAACPGDIKSSTIITNHNDLTWQWGNYVKLQDGLKQDLFACHMARRAVAVGNAVNAGDKLGVMGNTGYSFGAHTHWEARTAAGDTINPGELFGLPNMAGVTWDREAMEAAVIGYLDCTVASYRWRKGAGTGYALYKPSNVNKSLYCRVGVTYRVYTVVTLPNGEVWCQITPPTSCAAAGSPPVLWVSAACGTCTAKKEPEGLEHAKPEPGDEFYNPNDTADWDADGNDFIVSASKGDREHLRRACAEKQLPVQNA